ncbi:aldehyde dehydrogenase family protein [Amycolatopsis sp. NPDC049868]|uniref:aldehyde dehydrogenase family protein n=1 Tax=Amycolatopsis sp. NPDC049868 TaxID=3363934 RepID=UPI00379EA768
MSALYPVDALGPDGPYRTAKRLTIADVAGVPVAELSQVPPLYARRVVSRLRSAAPLPPSPRYSALAKAARLFASETGDISLAEHHSLVARVSGVPVSAVRAATEAIVRAAESAASVVEAARPAGTEADWRTGAINSQRAVWGRRGEVLVVHAPGNHPGVHAAWLEALALGYRVAVRPSSRDPLTPHRLVLALRAAGFAPDHVALLPSDRATAHTLIRAADRAIVYGGEDMVNTYAAEENVLVQGPGRSKILLADNDWERHLDVIVDSVSGYGGTACVNATAVLVAGDPVPVAEALHQRLASLPPAAPELDGAVLPAFSSEQARSIEAYLRSKLHSARLLGGPGLVDELPGGGAVLRPAVILLDRPVDTERAQIELPFPCVWVLPWSAKGISQLENSLVVTVFSVDDDLLDRLVAADSIRNVHIGHFPTFLMQPALPHDGYLAEFLMRSKTVLGR